MALQALLATSRTIRRQTLSFYRQRIEQRHEKLPIRLPAPRQDAVHRFARRNCALQLREPRGFVNRASSDL
jgi:hypothetical protein